MIHANANDFLTTFFVKELEIFLFPKIGSNQTIHPHDNYSTVLGCFVDIDLGSIRDVLHSVAVDMRAVGGSG